MTAEAAGPSPVAHTPTIRIAADAHPAHADGAHHHSVYGLHRAATASGAAASQDPPHGGVIYSRTFTRTFSRTSADRRTLERRTTSRVSLGDGVEEGDVWQPEKGRAQQVFRGTTLLW